MTSRQRSQRAALWLATATLLLGLAVPAPALAAGPDPAASPSAGPAAPVSPEPIESPPEPADPPAAEPAVEPVDLPPAVPLEGLLRVTPIEPEPRRESEPAQPMPSGKTVTLHTPDGTSVELTGDAIADVSSGELFRGTVKVDKAVATVIEGNAEEQPVPQEAAELGELVADTSATLDKPLRVVKASTTTVVKPTAAKAHTVDIMYVHAAGKSTPSAAEVDKMVSRLSEFWASETNGQISKVTLPVAVRTAAVPASQLCDSEGLWEYAAGPAGFNRTPAYQGYSPDTYYWAGSKAAHLVVVSPSGSCGYGIGRGSMGSIHSGGVVWASLTTDPVDWDGTVFHEVGHNLGLEHSNVTVCEKSTVVDGPSCEMLEYADYYDVMGGGYSYHAADGKEYTNSQNISALNVTHKVLLDALPRGSALREVRVKAGKQQEFTLAPAGGKTDTRGLEIVDPLNQDKLYVEYRSGSGRDAESFYTQYSAAYPLDPTFAPGVRVLKIASGASSVLLRWDGDTPALSHRAGDEFRSRSRDASGKAGVRIQVVSTNSTEAKVRVSFDALLPVESQTPIISGTPRIGVTLTAKPGKWTSGTSFKYQWLVSGKAVKGATKSTFVPRKADLGSVVAVRVTGTKSGYSSVTKTSATTAKVLPLKKLTTKKPSISGTPRIGVTLTAKPGKWTSGTSFKYQWLVSGKAVKGATKSTFVPRKSDKGKQVTVKVTGTKPGYASASTTSKKSSKVRPLQSMKTATPQITGTAKIGGRLTAKPGKWTAGAKLTYQWLVGGKAVAGATASTFIPRTADRGRTIKVKVTGTKAGYKTTSKTSKATRAVT